MAVSKSTTASPQPAPQIQKGSSGFAGIPLDTAKFGHWTWRDDYGQLELVVNSTLADRKDRGKYGGRNMAKGNAQGAGNTLKINKVKKDARILALSPLGRRSPVVPVNKAKPAANALVTLADVKQLALTMRSQANPENPLVPLFIDLQEEKEYDSFLMYLLHYFKCYFDKRKLENKPNPMNIEPSHEEKALLAEMGRNLDYSRKLLGQAYTILLISGGHRSHQAKKYMASTHKRVVSELHLDRGIYENLYSTCVFVVWVTFRRKEDYHVTNLEFDRLLRSPCFNRAMRQRNVSVIIETDILRQQSTRLQNNRKASVAGLNKPPKQTLTAPQYRRLISNRPPITTIIHQRSPAHIAVMANSREKSQWLFSRRGENALVIQKQDEHIIIRESSEFDLAKLHIGIIGEKMSLFNLVTLTPLDDERPSSDEAAQLDEQGGATLSTQESQAKDTSKSSSNVNPPTTHINNTHDGGESEATTDIADDITEI